jgi:hypothetical protein
MEKINTIIFSKDRSMQLQLLLDSMKANILQYNDLDIHVIYKASTENYRKGYEILKGRKPEVDWIEEVEFKRQVMELLEKVPQESIEEVGKRYIQFGVDDDIFYKKYDMEVALKCMEDENVFTFSPRLGRNVGWCHNLDLDHKFVIDKETENSIEWNWTKSYGDLGYNPSLDFNLYRLQDIKKLAKTVGFANPNTLEGNLAATYQYFFREQMASPVESVMIGVPVNITQTVCANKAGLKYPVSTKTLNDRYLNGEIIDLENLSFDGIKSCHHELEYVFKKA